LSEKWRKDIEKSEMKNTTTNTAYVTSDIKVTKGERKIVGGEGVGQFHTKKTPVWIIFRGFG